MEVGLNGDMHIQLCTNVVYHQICILCDGELKETGGITNQCSELEGKANKWTLEVGAEKR